MWISSCSSYGKNVVQFTLSPLEFPLLVVYDLAFNGAFSQCAR
jgi:hypothetical protein